MTTVQVAIIIPAFLLWLMLIVQFGLWWHAKQVANAAAAEAVDAAQTPTGTEAQGVDAARSFLDEAGNLRHVTVIVDRGADTVRAEVKGEAPQLVPGFDWGVTAQSEAPRERYIPESGR
ncbi:pilus assembly protein [Aquihabitans sp. G128]|uniref:TadE family protein n=1 Tax=Aquihabitans sp. G128 TaxID=2849779 RepID=UPI001C21E3DA|nr:TadE family protein [Aquihabitans sp. G128]QXC60570.1 pilus assembly protein [Aquihabitans sp. G128]